MPLDAIERPRGKRGPPRQTNPPPTLYQRRQYAVTQMRRWMLDSTMWNDRAGWCYGRDVEYYHRYAARSLAHAVGWASRD